VQQRRRLVKNIGLALKVQKQQPLSVKRAANGTQRVRAIAASNNPIFAKNRKSKTKGQIAIKVGLAERTVISRAYKKEGPIQTFNPGPKLRAQ
jgi:hypothetical protein